MEHEYTIGLYEKSMPGELGWKDKLEAAKTAGFDFVEISIDETDEKLGRLRMPPAERLMMVNLMKIVGMPIHTMCLSGHRRYPLGSREREIRARGMEIMAQAISLADDLGIRIIQLAGYDVYYEESNPETLKYFEDNLQKVAALAARIGVVLGFETMETEFMNTVSKSMKYVNQVSSAYLNIYPDIGNLTNAAQSYGTDVLADLQAGKGRLVAMHLKETKPGYFREIPFGEGHVDFERGIETAWQLGVRKYVTEFWYTGNSGWRGELLEVNQVMRKLLDLQTEEIFDRCL